MTGYTRQSTATIVAGEIVRATPLNNEFDALQTAFGAVTGHTHDGTVGNGPKIDLTTSVSGVLSVANGGTGVSSGTFVTTTGTQTLTNKSLSDSTTYIIDESDNTKKFQFQASGISTATTRTYTVPNFDGTLATLAGTETFTNKTITRPTITLQDSLTTFQDNSDNTKQMQFELSGITTGQTRTLTVPDFNGTIATLAGTETFTNKTLTTAVLTTPTITGYTETRYSANTSTAITIDLANGTVQDLTLTDNCTFTFPANTAGKSFLMILRQDATGSRTATWDSDVKWPSSTAPTITSTASKADLLAFTCDGTYWYGRVIGQLYL